LCNPVSPERIGTNPDGGYLKQYLLSNQVFYFITMQIQTMLPTHWPAVKNIYEEGIATGNATFATTVPDWEEWDAAHAKNSRLVAIENNEVLGWAALTPVSGRCVYAGVGEVSVHVAAAARGKGVGKKLLQALIEESEKNNFWTLQAGIFPENEGSVKIHLNNGFRIIGSREKIGAMPARAGTDGNGIWRDTLLLERRSDKVGL
jgi:L-amino acid N-acyltransferase YncA